MLYEYECVVIPGFGGFIAHYQPAQILADKNLILPPSKHITFNSLVKKNDGLLAQEIVSLHQLSYSEAIRLIEAQVEEWLGTLSENKSLKIPNVGSFTKDKNATLLFKQDSKNNLLNDAYGLGIVKAQIHKKEGISGKIKEEFVQRQASPVFNKTLRKVAAGGSIAAVFLVMLIWSYLNFDMVQQGAESLGLFFNSSKEKIHKKPQGSTESDGSNHFVILSNDVDSVLLKSVIKSVDELFIDEVAENSTELEEQIIEAEPKEDHVVQEENAISKVDNTEVSTEDVMSSEEEVNQGNYIVVAGCFRSIKNATNFVNELKSLGYDAELSGHSVKGLHRVAYGSYNTEELALKSMRWIQSTHNVHAWMTRR